MVGPGAWSARRDLRRELRRLVRAGVGGPPRAVARALVDHADDARLDALATAVLAASADPTGAVEVLVETGDRRLAAALVPRVPAIATPAHRALVLFLAGGSEEAYAELDHDGVLLRRAWISATPPLRQALLDRARATGRLDWVRAVTGRRDRPAGDLARLTAEEWSTTTELLLAGGRLSELWDLATRAPAGHAARMLVALDDAGGTGGRTGERAELTALARQCVGTPCPVSATWPVGTVAATRGVPPTTSPSMRGATLAVGPDGTTAVVHGFHGAQAWRLPDGSLLGSADRARSEHGGSPAAFSADGSTFVVGDHQGGLHLLDTRTGRWRTQARVGRVEYPLGPRVREMTGMALNRDGSLLAVADRRRGVRVWRLPSFDHVATLHVDRDWTGRDVHAVGITPDDVLVALTSFRGRTWHLPDLEARPSFDTQDLLVPALAVGARSDRAVLWERTGRDPITVVGLPAGDQIGRVSLGGPVSRVVGAGDRVYAVTADGAVQVVDVVRGRRLHRVERCLPDEAGGDLAAIAGAGGGDRELYHLPTATTVGTLGGSAGLDSFAVTPDGATAIGVDDQAGLLRWSLVPERLRTPIDDLLGDTATAPGSAGNRAARRARRRPGAGTVEAAHPWHAFVDALVRHRLRYAIALGEVESVGGAGATDISVSDD